MESTDTQHERSPQFVASFQPVTILFADSRSDICNSYFVSTALALDDSRLGSVRLESEQ